MKIMFVLPRSSDQEICTFDNYLYILSNNDIDPYALRAVNWWRMTPVMYMYSFQSNQLYYLAVDIVNILKETFSRFSNGPASKNRKHYEKILLSHGIVLLLQIGDFRYSLRQIITTWIVYSYHKATFNMLFVWLCFLAHVSNGTMMILGDRSQTMLFNHVKD